MPGMDGLTLLSKLSEPYPPLKAVIISAYGDMQNIRTAMNRGAFDFITKPIDFQDLEITLARTIREAAAKKQAAKDREQLRTHPGRYFSDAVNLTNRIEGLCKFYGASIAVSEITLNKLSNRTDYHTRFLGQV